MQRSYVIIFLNNINVSLYKATQRYLRRLRSMQIYETIFVLNCSSECRRILDSICDKGYAVRELSLVNGKLPYIGAGQHPVLAVADVSAGNESSYDILRALCEEPQLVGVPVLAFAGGASVSDARLAAMGAAGVLCEGMSAEKAHSIIRRAISAESDNSGIMNPAVRKELLRMAETDEKTGLSNRYAFCRKASHMIKENPDTRYVIVRWDFDRFKVYNDIFGISEGDRLLRAVGDTCSKIELALCAHLDADHFACCIPKEKLDTNMLSAFAAERLIKFSPNYELVIRFGVYEVEDSSLDVNLMCDRALMALRSIKGSYTNHVAWYDDAMRSELLREQEIIGQMETALAGGQFHVYLQPQFDHSNGTMVGAEALVRWIHPQKGLISPGAFIPLFERNGFISRLDEYVWDRTCALLRGWLDMGLTPVPVSVNISRQDLYNPQLNEILLLLIKKYKLDVSLLRLEITESAYVEDPELIISVVKKLQACGFYVEMDDFGAGYSSLNSLKDIPVNMLKLDMRFVRTGEHNDKSGIILTSIVRMAMWLGVSVLAEGVETARQADYLKTIGCELVQGYLYARPMPAEEFEKLLVEKEIGSSSKHFVPVSYFNSREFWDPEAQATVIFNSFVGAACIFEYNNGDASVVRANDLYFSMLRTKRGLHGDRFLHLLDIVFEEDRAMVIDAVERAIATDNDTDCEAHWHNDSFPGGCQWIRTRFRVIAHGGDRHALYASLEDVTNKRRIARELDERRMSLQLIYDTIPCGILQFMSDEDGNFKVSSFNDEVPRLFGYESRESMLSSLDSLIYKRHVHPDDLEAVRTAIIRVINESGREDFDTRVVRADGSVCWVRVLLQRLATGSGMLLQCVFADVTQNKKDELDLYERSMFALYDVVYLINSESSTSELRFTRDSKQKTGEKHDLFGYMNGWMEAHVDKESREHIASLFLDLDSMKRDDVRTADFCYLNDEGATEWVSSVMICAGGGNYLLCARSITAQHEADKLAAENAALRATMLVNNVENERNRLFMEHSGVLVVDYDPIEDEMVFRRRLSNGTVDTRQYKSVNEFINKHGSIHPDYKVRVESAVDNAKRRSMRGSFECLADYDGSGYKFYRIDYVSVADENGVVYRVVGIMTDIQKAKDDSNISSALIGRLAVPDLHSVQLESLAEQVFRLLYEVNDIEKGIMTVLEVFGRKIGASRTYIVEDDGDGVYCTKTFEWCADGVSSMRDKCARYPYPYGSRERYLETLVSDNIFAFDDISALEPDTAAMYEAFGVKALAQFAIVRNGEFRAALGFDSCDAPQHWSKSQLDQLSMVARRVGTFLIAHRDKAKPNS